MVQHVVLGLLLDQGAQVLARVLSALFGLIVVVLLLALAVPVVLLAGPTGPSTITAPRHTGAAPVSGLPAPAGAGAVEIATHYLGVPYVFGGTNPALGLDCSGLVQLVFAQLGTRLPRTAQLQYEASTRLTREQLQPGDLVFFSRTYADPHDWITHVGIYAGGGMQINAPTPGQVVSIQPVFSGFWGAHFAGGGRVHAP
jgi:cell wall-associated NlpC family hydrolase